MLSPISVPCLQNQWEFKTFISACTLENESLDVSHQIVVVISGVGLIIPPQVKSSVVLSSSCEPISVIF